MREEIIELCCKLKNINHCKICGGNHQNGICIYCGKENQEIIYLSLLLEKIISKLPDDFFSKNQLDPVLTELYSIRNMEIPIVKKVLEDSCYESKVIETYSYLNNYIQDMSTNKEALTEEQYHLILTSFFNQEFSESTKLMIANIITKAILEQYPSFSISNQKKEQFFLKMTELIATNILGFNVSHSKIREEIFEKNENILGSAMKNNIFLSRQTIHEDTKKMFVTIFHELIHLKQYKEQEIDKIISKKNIVEIKDKILSVILPMYYKNNYQNISFEQEAFLYEYGETIDYFNTIGVSIPKEFYEQHVLQTNFYSDFVSNMNRSYQDKTVNLDELFKESILSHPEYLQRFPQLNFEYKLENNQVLPKTLQEIENDYQNYQNGCLNWNGDKKEIELLYQEKIESLQKQNKSI